MKKRKKIKKIIVNNETIGIDVYNINDGDTIVVTLDKDMYHPAERDHPRSRVAGKSF